MITISTFKSSVILLLLTTLISSSVLLFTSAATLPRKVDETNSSSTELTSTIIGTTLRKRGGGGGGSRGSSSKGSSSKGISKPKIPKPVKKPGKGKFDDDDDERNCQDLNGDGEIDLLTECFQEEEDDDTCFPADSIVTVYGKGSIPIASLSIGDKLLIADGSFSPVYHFSHHVTSGSFPFVTFHTKVGTLSASAGHFLMSDGKTVVADSLNVGDVLDVANGSSVRIDDIVMERKVGLFNPHTLAGGEFVVNGFKVSEFTKAASVGTATGALAPLRALYKWCGIGSIAEKHHVRILHGIVRTFRGLLSML